MRDSVTVIWSFRNRIDVLKRSITTADQTCPKNINFCLVDASSDESTIKELREFCNTIKDRKIRIAESAYRSSLSEAWNLGMMLSDTRYVIFSSSDVEFITPTWFGLLNDAMKQGLEYILLENHAVFGVDKKAIPKMGWFDEGYKVGPHFDVDFMIRASENNVKFGILNNRGYYKHGHDELEIEKDRVSISDDDEKVKDRLPMNDKFNENYFKKKWQSDWEGWHNWSHPPTHISQVKRQFPEIDPHPEYTKKFS